MVLSLISGSVGHQTIEWVKANNIVAFYDNSDSKGTNFDKNYGNKKVKLTKNGVSFIASIIDTCGNSDCNGCCAKNSRSGFLIDVESFTAIRNFGSLDAISGTVQWELVDASTPSTPSTPATPAKATPKSTPPAAAKCSWPGHCIGASCSSDSGCSDDLVCSSSKCADASSSATVSASVDETTTANSANTSSGDSVPGWGIALLVLAALMVVVLLVVIAMLLGKTKKPESF